MNYVLQPYHLLEHQYFREWLAAACARNGFCLHWDFKLPWSLKLGIGKVGLCRRGIARRKMLVLSGGRPEYFAWPWCYFFEIVPVVWDCWPKYWPFLLRFVRKMKTRTIFVTSSQVVQYLKENVPGIDAVWLPEGIDADLYPMGGMLIDRKIDILELGRVMRTVHNAIESHDFKRPIKHLYSNGKALLFPDAETLSLGMRDAKIAICYPRCDTHPEMAGNVETLTQRYWEFMLSGALIVGRAPRELVEFCGYNPVVELKENPADKVDNILEHIEDYQGLVDRNRLFAEEHASWDARMPLIQEHLK